MKKWKVILINLFFCGILLGICNVTHAVQSNMQREWPTISNFRIVNEGYVAPCTVTIEAEIDETKMQEGDTIAIVYNLGDNYNYFTKAENGKYQTTIELANKYQKLRVESINIQEEGGCFETLMSRQELIKAIYGENTTIKESDDIMLDLIPSNYQKDSTPPELLSFSFSKNILYTPNRLEIMLDLKEEESGFQMEKPIGEVYLKNENGTYENCLEIWIYNKDEQEVSSEFILDVDFSRYEKPGKIYIEKINLRDRVGNETKLSVKDGTLEKKEVEIITDDTKYTLETETTKPDYIHKISQLQDGDTVLCNIANNTIIPKELFETIKGKDITITFESIADQEDDMQGAQWIINGKDIIHETKDIDMKINWTEDRYYPYYRAEFPFKKVDWENLPQNQEELYKIYTEQVELLKKYYQYLEKLGYENNEQNLAKGLQVMKEVYESGQSVVMDAETAIWNSTQWYWYLDMEFAENGILPCEVTIRIKPEYAYRGYFNEEMNLVYVDGENYTYLTEGIKLGVDDYFTFKVSHNSEYWLINDNMKKQMIKMAQKQENENKPEEPEQVVDKDKKPNQDNEEKDEADKIIDDEPDTGITGNEVLYVSIMACISLISIKKVINKGRKER